MKFRAAARLPEVVGVKVTPTVHVAFTASEPGQLLLEIAKSPGLAPAIRMLVMVKAEVPPFVSTTDCAALVLATAWLP